jgi:hypothetical protein
VSPFVKSTPFLRGALALLLLSSLPLGWAAKKIKQIKANANSASYVAFSKKLEKEERFRHALDRLTFGPRPGDFERIQSLGLKKWLDAELHSGEGAGITDTPGPAGALRKSALEHS